MKTAQTEFEEKKKLITLDMAPTKKSFLAPSINPF